MKNKITLGICLFLATISTINAQVKIGNNPNTINANSLLELESSTKGFLAPRVAINDLNSVSPLTATTPEGMLVYSTGGTVTDGFYNWNGSKWVKLYNSHDLANIVTKTANSTLLKTDAIVFASNDITLTLPVITSADNGLAITIKNTGSYKDLITVIASGSSKIDILSNSLLFRWQSYTYVAYESNWYVKEKSPKACNILDVSSRGSWTTLQEVMEFLDEHMCMPVVVRLVEGTMSIDNTIIIDLPYPLTIEGASYGTTTIEGSSSIDGNPLFDCLTECYFKKLIFTAYSNTSGNDGIHLSGNDIYAEVKDSYFIGFNKGIVASKDNSLWNLRVTLKIALGLELK